MSQLGRLHKLLGNGNIFQQHFGMLAADAVCAADAADAADAACAADAAESWFNYRTLFGATWCNHDTIMNGKLGTKAISVA